MSTQLPPQSLQSILALRPPLATSTRTDLAPSFKMLKALVEAVYGIPGRRGIEPGLWLAQMTRLAHRAAELLQAVWSKFGGQTGVTVDDEGESGRGIMKLQGLLSDLQMFASSLASIQDPLTTILLEPEAFERTQATLRSLYKKLASLVTHYNVLNLVSVPPDQWPEQDGQDKAEDLAALPILIAKSRPNKTILKKFEAELVLLEEAKGKEDETDGNGDGDGDQDGQGEAATSEADAPSDQTPPSQSSVTKLGRRLSVANSGLSAAKRSEFLRFVYSRNPHLISDGADLETAVSTGTAVVSSMGSFPKSHLSASPSASSDSSRSGQRSLVQQRISSFAASGDKSPPALPSSLLPHTSLSNRRIVSDSAQSTGSRKSWTVDISGLEAVQRRSSGSFSRPAPTTTNHPRVSVTAPPVRWRTPSILSRSSSRAGSVVAAEDEESKTASTKALPSSSPIPENPKDPGKSAPLATFAEQAAALVAARNQRSLSQTAPASWKKANEPVITEKNSRNSDTSVSSAKELAQNDFESQSDLPKSTSSLKSSPPPTQNQNKGPEQQIGFSASSAKPSSQSTKPPSSSSSPPARRDEEPVASPNRSPLTDTAPLPRSLSGLHQSTVASASPRPSTLSLPAESSATTRSSSPQDGSFPNTSTSSTASSATRRTQTAPPEPDLNFELVPDLIEHTSLLDAIVTPSVSSPEPASSSPKSIIAEKAENPPASTSSPSPSTDRFSTNLRAEPSDATSLQDLLEHASMYESWIPSGDGDGVSEKNSVNSEGTRKDRLERKAHQSNHKPVVLQPLSPPISPHITAPLSPPSTAGALKSSSGMSDSPISSLPSASDPRAFETFPVPLSRDLTISESIAPKRPSSGNSWATSFVSISFTPSDSDQHTLAPGVPRLRSLSIVSGSVPPPKEPLKSGWRILCLDGGGVRGLSMLYIVQRLLVGVRNRLGLKKTPMACECFEMICGVGTGGIIALLLGRLKLSIESAIVAYLKIVRNVFGQSKGILAALMGKTRFSASKLEASMRGVLRVVGENATLAEGGGRCKTFVMAMKVSRAEKGAEGPTAGIPRTLRSYSTRKHAADRCTVYQAARATSASPLFFKPIKLESDPMGPVPNDASLNNPSLEAVNEARSLFPERPIDCLISIGAGRGAGQESGSIARACAEIAESCENAAQAVKAMAGAEGWLERYARFNIERLGNDDSNAEWDNPDSVEARVAEYFFQDGRAGLEEQTDNLTESWKLAYEGEEVMKPGGKFVQPTLRTSSSEDRLWSGTTTQNYLGSNTNGSIGLSKKSLRNRMSFSSIKRQKAKSIHNEQTGANFLSRSMKGKNNDENFNRDLGKSYSSSSYAIPPSSSFQIAEPIKLPELSFE